MEIFSKSRGQAVKPWTYHRYMHWKARQCTLSSAESSRPSILWKTTSCKYERLPEFRTLKTNTIFGATQYSVFKQWNDKIKIMKNTGTCCPLPSSFAKMLKYSVLKLLFSSFPVYIGSFPRVLKIVLRIECSLNWQSCIFFFLPLEPPSNGTVHLRYCTCTGT